MNDLPILASASAPEANPRSIRFVGHWRPPLASGEYRVTVRQSVCNTNPGAAGTDAAISDSFENVRVFAVHGERFRVEPNELITLFPPANNQGEYGNVLPHAVLKRRTLPWERSPELRADDNGWLALLLFEGSDVPALKSAQVGDLQRARFPRSADDAKANRLSDSNLERTTASYPDGYALLPGKPSFAPTAGENLWDPCRVIDVDAAVFAAIAPSLEELQWLAHARTVTEDTRSEEELGSFSVVVGNRLPVPNGLNVVHLVSLEGMAKYLPTNDGETPSPLTLAAGGVAGKIRLISLANWSFTSIDPAETFSGILAKLDTGSMRLPAPADTGGEAAGIVANAFAMGYTALDHNTRLGDTTVSWYRGPLLPFSSSPVIVPSPTGRPDTVIATADQAVRFNPATGMMDVTYAAAWQIGRALALQNTAFATSLQAWKYAVARIVGQRLETGALARQLSPMLPVNAVREAPVPLASLSPRQFQTAILDQIIHRLAAELAPPPAAEPPAAEPKDSVMTPLVLRRIRIETLQTVFANPDLLAEVLTSDPPPVPVDLSAWLGNLAVLQGVPFGYLVPDAAMLPPESVRFFTLDPNWIHALLQGAASIGRASSADLNLDTALVAKLFTETGIPSPVTGFVMRSSLVHGWPELNIAALNDRGEPLTRVLRSDRLAPTVLLHMVAGTIKTVVFREPPSGLHFGIDPGSSTKGLRYVTVPTAVTPGTKPGSQIPGATVPATFRAAADGRKVVKVRALAEAIRAKLKEHKANNEPSGADRAFTSAEFALQLVEGAQSVRFEKGAPE